MELSSTLQNLGLSKKEADVYLALLSLGKVTGYQVAKKSSLDRSTTYFLLHELRKKGLVILAPQEKKQYFLAKNPQVFIEEKKYEVSTAEALLPQLLELAQKRGTSQTLHFDGAVSGPLESLSYMLKHTKEKRMYAFISYTPEGHSREIDDSLIRIMEQIKKKGIKVQGVAPEHESINEYVKKHFSQYDWNVRLFSPQKYDMRSSIVVLGDLIRITSRKRDMSIVIENDEIANTARQIFSLVWNFAEPSNI